MKIALSIPDELFESGETFSKRLGVSRSRLYATALAEFVAKHRGRKVTDWLNAVYASEDSRLPRSVRRLQGRSLAARDVVVERGQVWWADSASPTAPDPDTTGPC